MPLQSSRSYGDPTVWLDGVRRALLRPRAGARGAPDRGDTAPHWDPRAVRRFGPFRQRAFALGVPRLSGTVGGARVLGLDPRVDAVKGSAIAGRSSARLLSCCQRK